MSHFTVLVIGENIEEQLQPYHEYECTGIEDQYVRFVEAEETKEELEAKFKEHNENGDFESLAEFLKDYYGYVTNEQGKFGRMTNPNAKWDWWLVGGRWTGFFKLKVSDDVQLDSAYLGRPGIFTRPVESGNVDSALKKDIDFEGMRNEAEKKAAELYDKVWAVIKDTPESEKWDVLRDRFVAEGKTIDDARTVYHAQPRVVAFKTVEDIGWFGSVEDFNIPREDYLRKERNSACTTYAVVKDSKWYQKGEMGWWGMSSDEMTQEEWNQKFNEMIDSASDDTRFTLVDCHI